MGKNIGAPINEAVFLLNQIAPAELEKLASQFPGISDELKIGRIGGESEGPSELDRQRAQVMIRALDALKSVANHGMAGIKARMILARQHRLWAQIAALVCSSGVLGALAIKQDTATILAALLSLLSSVGVILAEHKERLLKQGDGDVYTAYEAAGNALYKAGLASENLRLMINHNAPLEELRTSIAAANGLCEELSSLVIQMSGTDSMTNSDWNISGSGSNIAAST